MRKMILAISFIIIFAMVGCGGSGGGSGDGHIPMGNLLVIVDASSDDSVINDASISVYDDKNLIITKGITDIDGEFEYALSPGSYYVKVAAQGFKPVPLPGQDAIPFEIIDNQTTTEIITLDDHSNVGNTGQISGNIKTPAPNSSGVSDVLVVAKDAAQNLFVSGTSGPEGDYNLFNIEPGSYTLSIYRAGYREKSNPITVDVVADGNHEQNDIEIEMHDNADLNGKVTFLAVVNGVIDITLFHPDTLDTIPGLSTQNDTNNNYLLEAIPLGTFIAWASYRNDGYVMDPDRISKFGLPQVSFTEVSSDQTQDFEVTGAVTIIDPSNESSLVVPQAVDTSSPTFTWEKYPSAKEYIIEVFDAQGNTIWGGFDTNGVVQHPQIGQNETSIIFDFDNSATTTLQDGETYRWKIYADDSADAGVQNLISSSEHQMGLFTYTQN
ncbi:carboxypeptidase regulatory-like domain-containing protein [Thermodesulfobacteriota bacterium]